MTKEAPNPNHQLRSSGRESALIFAEEKSEQTDVCCYDGRRARTLAIGHVKEPDKKYPGRLPTEKIAFAEKYGGAWNGNGK